MSEQPDKGPEAAAQGDGQWPHVVDLLAENEQPIEVDQFELCDQGRLARRRFDMPLEFSFVYDGGRFDCRVDLSQDEAVEVSAKLARLPYTAESPRCREKALRLLSASDLLPSGRLSISEGGWIRFEGRKAPPRPCTPACVMASVVALVLELRPMARLLRQTLDRVWLAEAVS